MTLESIITDAIEDLTDQMRDGRNADEAIPEIADSAVPVYNYDVLNVVAESSDLWNAEPECGCWSATTPVRVCQLVIYDAVEQALYEAVDDIREELDEETEDEADDEADDEIPMPTTASGTCHDCRYGTALLSFRYCQECSTLTSPWSHYKYQAYAA